MLTVKYRPQSMADVVGHKKIVESLNRMIATGDIPHLLFVGKPGTGKTAIAYAIARELGIVHPDFKEINSSDHRGIDTIRNEVIQFAKTMSFKGRGALKIILLDEADALTKPAQQSLRRTMEKYPHVRFILTGNDTSKIHAAVQSRCTTFFFKGLHYRNMDKLIGAVAKAEGMALDKDLIASVRKVSSGDARKALNTLEALRGVESPTVADVYDIVGSVDDANLFGMLRQALAGDIKAIDTMNGLLNGGANSTAIIRTMYHGAMKGSLKLKPTQRLLVLRSIGSVPGSSDDMKLGSIMARMIMSHKMGK